MEPAASPALPSATRTLTGRAVWAGMLGNVLEWYDFGLYGLLAPVLATTFFPAHDRSAALMGAYGGFAAGFAMRPIGAAVLGRLGDLMGRRYLLALSVLLMGISTLAMGLLPSYAQWGLWATGLLVAIRLLQGFSVGGEFVGSVTYLVESAPDRKRGLAGSVSNLGATVGLLLAALLAAWALGSGAAWAWRATFWLGGALALAALLLRRGLPEIPGPGARAPLRSAWRGSRRTLLLVVVFTAGYGIVNYLAMVLLPAFAHEFG
ncbi:MAG: MFS transporter, partial [Terriglobales bacterium]